VTADEHAGALDRLMSSREGVAAHIVDAPAAIEIAALTVARLAAVRSPIAKFLAGLLDRRRRRAVDGLLQTLSGHDDQLETWRTTFMSGNADARAAAVAALGAQLSPAVARRLADTQQEARRAFDQLRELPDMLRPHVSSPDPYVRATAYYLLESTDAASDADRALLESDDHPVVHDIVVTCRAANAGEIVGESSILEKMIGLKSIAILDDLEPEELARLARSGTESWFREGEALCREGEMGDDVFVLLDGEVSIVQSDGDSDRVLGTEGPGSCIGELAVLDPAPRGATVIASTVAVRTLRLTGRAFRAAANASPSVSGSIIRMLVRRLRRNATKGPTTRQ